LSSGLNWTVFVAATPVGLLATNILVVNNYRDAETDARAGKWRAEGSVTFSAGFTGATTVTTYTLQSPRPQDPRNITRAANAAALVAAFQTLTPVPPGGDSGNVFTFDPPLVVSDVPACTGVVDFVVPLGTGSTHTEKLRGSTASTPEGNPADKDKLRLRCIRP